MKRFQKTFALVLALMLLMGCAYAGDVNAKWTLGNAAVTIDGNEFIIGADAQLEIIKGDGPLQLEFGLNMGQKHLLPIAAELSADALNFSLGSRVYNLDIAAVIDELDLSEDEKAMLSHIGDIIESASALMGNNSSAYMQENDETINHMYEILVGKNAEPIEITVNEIQLPARKYAGELKIVHFVDLMEYMHNSEDEAMSALAEALLQLMNALTGEEYEYFFEYFYDGYFNDFFGAEDGESLGEAEIIFGYNDEIVYEKATISSEAFGTSVNESVYTDAGTVVKTTETFADEDNNYATHGVLEIDGPITAPTAIRMNVESDEGYTQKNEPANLTLTVRDVILLTFDAASENGLWNASFTGKQDTAAAYDYGNGPVVLNDEFDMNCSYAETLGDDGRITGKADLAVTYDDHSASLQFEIGRGEGADIASLTGENTQIFALDLEGDSMGNRLLAADAMGMAASAAELYADPGIYGLMSYITDDGIDWPDELSDDIYNRYMRAYHGSTGRAYRFADAARVFEGNMPRYSEPENSVLTGIWVGSHNMVLEYMSNDGDFWIDITYLSDQAPVPTNAVPVNLDDFTFIEEDDEIMAYYCDGDYLVFFDFEKPDRARAEEIISGLMLASKKVGLSA